MKTRRPRIATQAPRLQTRRHDRFYDSEPHKAWRDAVKARAGYACQDPNHPAGRPRSGRRARLVADHVVPIKQGGDRFGAGMCRCWTCHERKGALDRAAVARRKF